MFDSGKMASRDIAFMPRLSSLILFTTGIYFYREVSTLLLILDEEMARHGR